MLDVPSGAMFSLPGKHAPRSSSSATALIAAAQTPSCVLSARTSFSPLSLDSSAGKKVFISRFALGFEAQKSRVGIGLTAGSPEGFLT